MSGLGMGGLSNIGSSVGILSINTTPVGNVGGGEDTLLSYSLPAGSFSSPGKGVRVTAWGVTANNANPKSLKGYFGSVILTTALTISIAGVWRAEFLVFSTGTDTQRYSAILWQGGTLIVDPEAGTLTEDDGAAILLKFTGTVTDGGGGINNDDLVQSGMMVEYIGG